METFVVLADAGYVYASAGTLVYGTKARSDLLLNQGAFRDHLESFGRELTGVSMLRMYWYDAAPNRLPTPEHQRVANLRAVQLRLGRLSNTGVQKGVDSLIYRDLVTLSQSARISDVFLVAGDEDLLDGVNAAKDFGVRVSLVGIEPSEGNQSAELRQAADAIYILQREQLEPILQRRRSVESSQPTPTDWPSSRHQPGILDQDGAPTPTPEHREIVQAAARQVAREFWEHADEGDRSYLKQAVLSTGVNRRLPQRTDARILRVASDGLDRRLVENEKRVARAEFWKETVAILGEVDGAFADSADVSGG